MRKKMKKHFCQKQQLLDKIVKKKKKNSVEFV